MLNGVASICVMVSGGGTNLQALFDAEDKGILNSGKIVLVASSSPDAFALSRAESRGVDTYIMEDEGSLIEELKSRDIDMIVLAGFLRILSDDFVKLYPGRIINIHPALIPSFCGKGYYGLKVHEKALERGVKVTGATCHFVNEIPDGGKIISQKAVEVKEDDTPKTLQRRVMEEAEWILLPQAAEELAGAISRGDTIHE